MYEEDMPVFIRIDNYKEVIELMKAINKKLKESKEYLERISALKNEEDAKIEEWGGVIQGVENKIDFVNSALTEPKQK